eukprot:COSAG02_NODE_5869_length_3975_cov_3.351393_3_plen_106_part_00
MGRTVVVHAIWRVAEQRAQLRRDGGQIDKVDEGASPLDERRGAPGLLLLARLVGREGGSVGAEAPALQALRQPLPTVLQLLVCQSLLHDQVTIDVKQVPGQNTRA